MDGSDQFNEILLEVENAARKQSLFFDVLCPFRTVPIMALHKYLSVVALNNFSHVAISPKTISAINSL